MRLNVVGVENKCWVSDSFKFDMIMITNDMILIAVFSFFLFICYR